MPAQALPFCEMLWGDRCVYNFGPWVKSSVKDGSYVTLPVFIFRAELSNHWRVPSPQDGAAGYDATLFKKVLLVWTQPPLASLGRSAIKFYLPACSWERSREHH